MHKKKLLYYSIVIFLILFAGIRDNGFDWIIMEKYSKG